MYQAYKFRLYPSLEQIVIIHKTFGSTRFIYNFFLEKCKKEKYTSAYEMCKELKAVMTEYPWLKEVDACSLRCAIFHLEDAFKSFFSKRNGYPTFKNKYTKQSYRTNGIRSSYQGKEYSNIEIDLAKREIKFPKLGNVKIRGYRNLEKLEGKIIHATITRELTGKYYVSVVIKEREKEKVVPENIVGIDLGVKDLVVTSNGEKFSNPRELEKQEKRIKRLQRKLSRQSQGSKNYQKTKIKLARTHNRIKNSRRQNQIHLVNKLVKENDIIVAEKLEVKEMTKNHRLSKPILDASFERIIERIKWKTKKEGKYFYQVDRYYASSQICSVCGVKNEEVKDLKIRKWECRECGSYHDRDINASMNIMYEGLKKHYGFCQKLKIRK